MANKYKLKNVMLDEISLVDVPADPNATIAIWKRQSSKDCRTADKAKSSEKKEGGSSMDPKELAKRLEALEGQVTDLTKAKEASDAKLEAITKAADAAGFDVKEDGDEVSLAKRADPEYVEVDGEKVLKSAIPAPVLKRMQADAEENRVLKAKQDEVEFAKRGEAELPHLPGCAISKGKLLKAIEPLGEESLRTLKAADAIMAQHMLEKGSNPMDDESSATHRLHKMATDYQKENPGTPFESAYAEVTKSGDGLELMRKSRAEAK